MRHDGRRTKKAKLFFFVLNNLQPIMEWFQPINLKTTNAETQRKPKISKHLSVSVISKDAHEKLKPQSTIRDELANVSFEELQQLKETLGTKKFNAALFCNKSTTSKSTLPPSKSKDDDRPEEMSSKKKPQELEDDDTDMKKKVFRDPRFDNLSGNFSEVTFHRRYKFLEDLRSDEIKMMRNQLKKTEDEEKKNAIKSLIQRMVTKHENAAKTKEKINLKEQWKKAQVERIKQGKTPIYPKKSELKTLELVKKFETLKESGKLQYYMARKRSKIDKKATKRIPFVRKRK